MVKALNSAGITPILSLKNVHATACQGLACAPAKICAVPEEHVVAALKGLVWVRFYGKLAPNLFGWSVPDALALFTWNRAGFWTEFTSHPCLPP